jgi:hypothetical protein
LSLRPFGNIRYGDSVSLSYTSPEGFPVSRRYALPWLNAELNTHHVAGRAPYSTTITIELLRASEVLASAEVGTSSSGSFDAYLLDNKGSPAIVQTGDTVQMIMEDVAPIQFLVPELTVSADLMAVTVGGRAAPGSPVRVELRSAGCTYTQEVVADDSGAFLAPFRHIASPTIGDYGFVYWNSTDGHAVFTRYEMPAHRIFLPLLASNKWHVTGSK